MAQGKQWLNVVIFDYSGNPTPATILILSAASPPQRPTPGPTPPGLPDGIWGPSDPRPTLPIAGWDPGTGNFPGGPGQPPLVIWGPGDPRPTLPIAGWNPGTGQFPDGPGTPTPPPLVPTPPTETAPGVAIVRNAPSEGMTPPADMPSATYSDVYYGPGKVAKAWVGPYIEHHPGS
jgi:hypothetical protein